MKTIKIEFDIDDEYCYKKDNRFCPFIRFRKFGTIPVCAYFEEDLITREENNYQIERLEDCKNLKFLCK